MKPIRVLIVDDSVTMRRLIAATLSRDPGITVVGEAANPLEARQAIKSLNPDVMTLDVEMPHMNGLDFLEKVMRLRPFPVIMVSTLTARGTDAAIQGLELGAVDCIGKPSSAQPSEFDQLPAKVKAAARARVGGSTAATPAKRDPAAAYVPDGKLVAIGASTGGVEALITVVSQFPANCPPTVITLHLPAPFTSTFAQRLDRLSAAQVSEAREGDVLEPGRVYLAPGTHAHLAVAGAGRPRVRLISGELVNGHRPAVDMLFQSVAKACGERAVGVILTGMGNDGAEGLMDMRRAGARTIGQSEDSCVIYGMPRVAYEIGAVETQVPLARICNRILDLTNKGKE